MTPAPGHGPAARVVLRPGHVKPLWAGHPWVYAQAIETVEGDPGPGDLVAVEDPRGGHLGRGFWEPGSALPVRLLSRDPDEDLGPGALRRRLHAAAERRTRLLGLPSSTTDGYRLAHGEGDELPGLLADRYGSVVVATLGVPGLVARRDEVVAALAELPGVRAVRASWDDGEEATWGEPPASLTFRERGFAWEVPVAVAQKTGFYFDQRDNRRRVEELAAGRRVLDACCYLGAFALAAARGGAREVLALDRSPPVLELAARHAEEAGLADRIAFRQADVRRDLAPLADGDPWDLVVLDPPKLAPSRRHLPRAEKAYEGLNAAALRLVSQGGVLVTCSCSAAMGPEAFLRMLAAAARRARREVRLLELTGQAADHPTPPAFPEGRYLTCAFCEVT